MGIDTRHEVEQKYDVPDTAVAPPWSDLPEVGSVDAPVVLDLAATYFDTADLALARAGVTLRRRTGGDDAGWHLKLPLGGPEWLKVRLPLDPDGQRSGAVPEDLAAVVGGRLRGRACAPVATLHSRRVVHRLRDADGELVAEVCDDTVAGHVHEADGSMSTSRWREWEIEGTDLPEELATSLAAAVARAGGKPATAPSKLARALGIRLPPVEEPDQRRTTGKSQAAEVLLVHLRGLVRELQGREPQVRLDRPDAVHKMRVATRRLRSALTTFKPMFDGDEAGSLRDELKWLADILGEARDAEVLRDRLATLAQDQPGALGSSAVALEIDERMHQRHDRGVAHVREALDSPRYFALLDSLESLVRTPPWTDRARRPARKVLPKRVLREWARLTAQADQARRADDLADREALLHEVRKSGKRLRYACEAVTPIFGSPADELAAAARDVQDTLGDHRDGVVSQGALRELAAHTTLEGDLALVYGRLHLLEQARGERARTAYEATLVRVVDRRPTHWQ